MVEKVNKLLINRLLDFNKVYTQGMKPFDCEYVGLEDLKFLENGKKYEWFYCEPIDVQFVFNFDEDGKIHFYYMPNYFASFIDGVSSFCSVVVLQNGEMQISEKRNFEKAKFLCETIVNQKDKQLDAKSTLVLRIFYDYSKYYAFESIKDVLFGCCAGGVPKFSTNEIYTYLKQLSKDVNTLGLREFIEKYETLYEKLLIEADKRSKEFTKKYKQQRELLNQKRQAKIESDAEKAQDEMKL